MKYYIIAGEASGDLHGANLVKALQKKETSAQFVGFGGDLMKKNGVRLVKHYKDIAFMGIGEVIKHLPTILKAINFCKEDIKREKPDAVILIDYPGFNLRIAEFAKKSGIKVFYYISPQVWAWKESRVEKIKKYVDHMLVILPFEKQFFESKGMQVEFVGHPLIDALKDYSVLESKTSIRKEKPIVALLPGSRKQEIKNLLPMMSNVQKAFPDYEFVIAGAPSIEEKLYKEYSDENIRIVFDQTYQLLSEASYALVASGTATLETALFKVPEILCYKGSVITYWIGKMIVNLKYICLVNLILDRELVKELIQNECTVDQMEKELKSLISSAEKQAKLKKGYIELKEVLGGEGASIRTADFIINHL